MATDKDKSLVYEKISAYVEKLRAQDVKIWRLYLYGSFASGAYDNDSDIDLAIFLDCGELDGFAEDVQLMKLRRGIDLRIEPHAFARSDFDTTNPFIRTILQGERIV